MHPILKRLSHSSILLLHSCPRKYQLTKLLSRPTETNDDLSFGHAVGHGIQQLLLGRSKQEVWLEIFFAWGGDVIEYEDKTIMDRKTLWNAYNALDIFDGKYKEALLSDYDVATFNGSPACELGFRINIGADFQYRGFVDVVLIHKRTKKLVVLEIKTTKIKQVSAAKYANSGQGLGYSLVCDYIAQQHPDIEGSSYEILYFVFKTTEQDFQPVPIQKHHAQRAYWIKQLLMDVEHIVGYEKEGCWPMYGESCEAFGRTCEFFGACHMSDEYILKNVNPQVPEEKFTFDISLMDLINAQLERGQEALVL